MPTATEGRLIDKVADLVRGARSGPRRIRRKKPDTTSTSITRHLRDDTVSAAMANICAKLPPRHADPIREDLESGCLRPLAHFVVYMAFLESVSPPVRPLALHPDLGDWLLALPADQLRYYPADPCWECGYRYPGASPFAFSESSRYPARRLGENSPLPASQRPAVSASPPPHSWAGRKCFYCRGEIVNHLEWLGPDPKRSLADFQKAPYRTKRQRILNGDRSAPETPTSPYEYKLSREMLESMNLLP